MSEQRKHDHQEGCGCEAHDRRERFCVNTEGTEHPWDRPTITTEEIARLGGWDPAQGVIEVHADNTERTLAPGEVVHLRPGHAFCRRVRWKRGFNRAERIAAEDDLLRRVFPDIEVRDGWRHVPKIPMPPGWNRTETDVAFHVNDGFPGTPPYGIFVPAGLRYNGQVPQNYTEPAGTAPPFGGTWGMFSWSVADGNDWRPTASVEAGANLLRWVRGVGQRFAEGV